MTAAILVRTYSLYKYDRTCSVRDVPLRPARAPRPPSAFRDAIVAATVRIVAREGVAAVTHRRVAAEAGVALSSTTWHFATKADILEAALHWTARREVDRHRRDRRPPRRHATSTSRRGRRSSATGWSSRSPATARSRSRSTGSRSSCSARRGARAVHREWGEELRAVGERVLERSPTHDARPRRPARRRRPRRPADGRAQLGRAGHRVAAPGRPPPVAGAARLRRSTIIAWPMPPATHIVSSPIVPSIASRLLSSVVMMRAPVIPNGWPSAIAPP